MNAAIRWVRRTTTAAIALVIAGHAYEAQALMIQFSTTADTQTYFAGQPYETKAGFSGSGGSGCCVMWEGHQFAPRIETSIELNEGVALIAAVNKPTTKHPTAGWPAAGASASETHTLSYTFTLDSPNVVGANSVTFEMDLTVSFSSFGDQAPTMIFYRYGPNNQPLTHTFDLGLDGLLDVTFHPANSTSAILPAHIGSANTGTISATFLLRDVPDAVPEPGTLLLVGGGLLGLGALYRRRRQHAPD